MKELAAKAHGILPLALARQVDELCSRFEAVWKAGQRPRIEDYLADLAEPGRDVVQRQLIALEIVYRRRAGEFPQAKEYAARFPSLDMAPLASLLTPTPSGEAKPVANAAANDHIIQRLGDFEILREIGRGGMGIVYKARQVSLNRQVALKVLSSGLGLTPKAVQRFRREAEAAAKLHHTNIVPVYATGEENGTHFYAMELIEGLSLDYVIRRLRHGRGGASAPPSSPGDGNPELVQTGPYVDGSTALGTTSQFSSSSLGSGSDYFDTVSRMMAEVADALDYARQQGIIHRDIKPSNLLLSPAGRLSVNDFGLARILEQPGMTMTGEFVGTPAYMSPEQITSGRVPVDHRTDIYSLGATLYELLTLRPPFTGKRRDQVLAQILHKEPQAPRKVNKKVPVDLETVCLKALEKDPDRRYHTAGQMAEDLRRYVNRFAISARRAGLVARASKWAKRHPGVTALLGCLLLAVLVAGFFAYRAKQAQGQLLAEQRETALQKAILEAMSGDTQAALRAIRDAENKGASPGQLNMLRGFVEEHRGNFKEAIVHLEHAQEQLPDSVAVKALLAQAHFYSRQFSGFDRIYGTLDQLQPRTTEDYLFLGMVQAIPDPDKGVQTLDKAVARSRQSAVARLVRAQAQTTLAMMTGKVQDADQALNDIAKVDLPDDPLLVSARLRANLTAANAYGQADPARREAALKQAARDADILGQFPEDSRAVATRCHYFMFVNDDNTVLRELQRSDVSNLTNFTAIFHYAHKRFAEARRVLEKATQTWPEWVALGYVLATLPETKSEAERVFAEATRNIQAGASAVTPPTILLLLGPDYKDKARQASRDVRERLSQVIPGWRNRWYHDLLAYNGALMTAEELLQKAGASRFNQCEAYFYIGLNRLADGDRAKAKECFIKSKETGVFDYIEYGWSIAFLACIDDPNWLPWVPLKK